MAEHQFDAIIVGADSVGIGAAIQLKRGWVSTISCFSSARTTWAERGQPLPGWRSMPTTSYSYFFEPNPNWSRLFSTGTEISSTPTTSPTKYDVPPPHPLARRSRGARWDEDAGVWRVALAGGETLTARY